ncbi:MULTISPECIES: RcnB family protein [unclassified Sphingomonas]|uniref:RcnB family protein n=1 Tax=unclassified Sphingomonas TaxID=196159 RepID=UPI00226A0B78|nr:MULTISPECIES: RcnB family protein [unclassified Sphingomonas]
MRKLILSALAATLVASPLAVSAAEAAPLQQRQTTLVRDDGRGHTVVTQRTVSQAQHRGNWRKGERFDRRYASNYRQIDYRQYRGRHLYAPPRGYQWVQSGNDAVLIAVTSGLIGAVLSGALR